MIRIFSILLMVTITIIFITGGGTYWLSASKVTVAEEKIIKISAQNMASNLSRYMKDKQAIATQIASSANVIAVIKTGNTLQMNKTADLLEPFFPDILKIRLLPQTVSEPDETYIPHMGNADLMMVQETLSQKVLPVIQGQGEHRHLAVTAVVKENDESIGVILISFRYDFLKSIIKQSKHLGGLVELKQYKLTLAKAGDSNSKTSTEKSFKISHSNWLLYYWSTPSQSIFSLGLISFTLLPALCIIALFFLAYRILRQQLNRDLSGLLKAIKDLMAGKTLGSYPINSIELKAVISNLIQYKRIMDGESSTSVAPKISEEVDIDDGFFSEFNFGDHMEEKNETAQTSQFEQSTPIQFPKEDKK